jgi:hypothetical protein
MRARFVPMVLLVVRQRLRRAVVTAVTAAFSK